jgi:hypothetical protein
MRDYTQLSSSLGLHTPSSYKSLKLTSVRSPRFAKLQGASASLACTRYEALLSGAGKGG